MGMGVPSSPQSSMESLERGGGGQLNPAWALAVACNGAAGASKLDPARTSQATTIEPLALRLVQGCLGTGERCDGQRCAASCTIKLDFFHMTDQQAWEKQYRPAQSGPFHRVITSKSRSLRQQIPGGK